MRKYICLFIISIIFSNDSLSSEQKKIDWRMNLIPLLGQIKNEKYIKTGLLASFQGYSLYKFSGHNKNDQIAKRNTYAWWILGLYFYGVIDAYVDSSLRSFPKQEKNEVNK